METFRLCLRIVHKSMEGIILKRALQVNYNHNNVPWGGIGLSTKIVVVERNILTVFCYTPLHTFGALKKSCESS